jgi:hypothetical protein
MKKEQAIKNWQVKLNVLHAAGCLLPTLVDFKLLLN